MEIQAANKLAAANELYGTILINISVAGIALSQLLAKFIYTRSNISSLEFFATREMINLSMWIIVINFKLKHYMYDTITKPQSKQLFLRSIFGTLNGYFGAQNYKYFNLLFCGVSQNAAPITTCFFSAVFINEKMKTIDKFLMLIVVIGVTVMSLNGYLNSQNTNQVQIHPWWAYFGLFYIPIGSAGSNILMRKMKGLHFVQIALFKYVFMVPLFLTIFLIIGFDWAPLENFDTLDWILIVLAAIAQQSSTTFRFLAFKREKPAYIIHYQYLNSLYALCFSLFIFHAQFSLYSELGVGLMLCGYLLKFVHQFFTVRTLKK